MAKGKTEQEKGKLGGAPHIVGNVIGIALIAVLLPIMIANTTLIIKSYVKPNEVPSIFGVAPLIVQSGSMEPTILVDDLIFTKKVDPDTLEKGDIIAFQPVGEHSVVTHRIVDMYWDDEILQIVTQGDANNTTDAEPVLKPQVVGRYFLRLPGIGRIAMFLQQPLGMVVCVAVPLALFLLYDVLRRFLYNRKKKEEESSEKEELERLRALAASIEQGETPAQPTAPEAEAESEEEKLQNLRDLADSLVYTEPAPAEDPPVEGEALDDPEENEDEEDEV